MTLATVQQWVLTVLICTVATMPVAALVITAVNLQSGPNGDAVVLCVVGSLIGVLAVGASRLVHHLRPVSPLLMTGAVPGLLGLVLVVT